MQKKERVKDRERRKRKALMRDLEKRGLLREVFIDDEEARVYLDAIRKARTMKGPRVVK